MRRTWIVVAASLFVASGADAQERHPFHVAKFPDHRTVSLSIMSSSTPEDATYDYEIDVGLTELSPDGDVVFIDHGAHAVRVRCQWPGTVKVGDFVHLVPLSPQSGDWMQDLWKAVCLQPIS